MMPGTRPFVEADIGAVAALSAKLFPGSASLSDEEHRRRYREIALGNPWRSDCCRSLVYEDGDGRITGFVGVVPRPMAFNGRKISMAVTQHMMVDPDSRSTLAAVELMKRVMAGPQDLTVADMASDLSRRLWERLGGLTMALYSLHWRKPLRLASFLAGFRGSSSGSARRGLAARLAPLFDPLADRLIPSPHSGMDGIIYETMEPELLLSLIPDFFGDDGLLPDYDLPSLRWLFEEMQKERRFGPFQSMLVRDPDRNVLGWFLYHLQSEGTSNVLQIGARESSIGAVLDALFAHAKKGNSVELTGRIDPRFMREFTSKRCLCLPGRSWVLASAKDPSLLQCFYEGKAFLSRIEGDPWFF